MNEKPDDGSSLIAAYAEAMRPYTECGGAIPADVWKTRAWRYFIEINSGCNLRCVLCAAGNKEGYDYTRGNAIMDMNLLGKILDKIKSENPAAVVLPYGNSEPFLHPKLPEAISAIKQRGLRCEMASNFNHLQRLDEVLASGLDSLLISVSGFTQDTYGKSHLGGDLETVKTGLKVLAAALPRCPKPPHVMVHYHMYKDTIGAEFEQMKEFTAQLGFQFIYSYARAISMENTIQYLRALEKERTGTVPPFVLGPNGEDWEKLLPPPTEAFSKNIERLIVPPQDAVGRYAKFPVQEVCPAGDIFTFIRHDGQTSLCGCVSDQRLVLGSFLDLTQEQLSNARRGHPICLECLRYRLNLYYHVVAPPTP